VQPSAINPSDIPDIIPFIKSRLAQLDPKTVEHPDFAISAVLILLYPVQNTYNILFTVRSTKVHHHRGEISFPGGKVDKTVDKSLQETALRECQEEVGVDPKEIEIIGRLDDIATFTGFIIRPYIGIHHASSNLQYILSPDEVSEVILVPIDVFLRPKAFEEMRFNQYGLTNYIFSVNYIQPDTNKKYNIWGATAHILSVFLRIIYGIKVGTANYIRATAEDIARAKAEYDKESKKKQEK
jgi:8-oxo-dGTP pyrophosphatase MutT (NUDIX family)